MKKLNFRKISAIGASLLLTGMSLGVAAAAAYPAPFVEGTSSNVAVVYGSGAGVSILDGIQAGLIQSDLQELVGGSSGTSDIVSEGDSYKFEKTSTKFHLGDHYVNITSTLDEDELPSLLAEGKYVDDDNDEIDYTQKITMGALGQLMMFNDNDYAEDSPTVGFRIPSSQTILTYQIDFSDTLVVTDMPTTELPLMGRSYYVLSNTSTTLTLLDSAASSIVSSEDTVTLDVDGTAYEVTASIFDTANSKVKLTINGETTNLLAGTETQKLSDGAYVGVKEVIVQNFQGGVNQVEFSIGKGKLKLTKGTSNTDVQINDQAVSGLTSNYTEVANVISQIKLIWAADNDLFVTEDSEVAMPGFETIKLSYGGLNYPAEELVSVRQGGDTYMTLDNFPLKSGEADIDFLYGNSTYFTAIGKDASNKLITDSDNDGNITFDKDTDEYFIASWTDTSDAESYLMRATNFVLDGSTNKFDLENYQDGSWVSKKSGAKATDSVTIGSVDLTIGNVDRTGKAVHIWRTNSDTATSITSFNTLYSAEGLTVYLPYLNTTAIDYNTGNTTFTTAVQACDWAQVEAADAVGELGYGGVVTYNSTASAVAVMASATTTCVPEATTFTLKMVEEDKSENKYSGDYFNLTIGWDSSTTAEAEVSDIVQEEVTFVEIGDTDVWRSFMYSALATEFLWDKPSSGQKSVKIMYHGDEVAANVRISSSGAVITAGETGTDGGALGNVLYKDSEAANFADKNLIVVGGSCINSAAAALLGGSYCGADFTANTGVGAGEFVIKGYETSSITSELALLVAGYDVADTVNAVTYLKNNAFDTSASYKGTSATSAELIVA